MILKLVKSPSPILKKPVEPVKKVDRKITTLIADMIETLSVQTDPEGVGLAAPQVGVSLAIFIVRISRKHKATAYINPEILKLEKKIKSKSKKKSTALEGCLSVDRIWSPIYRQQRVQLSFTDIKGEKHVKWFEGFDSVIVQHEMDHLNGILFTQRAVEQGKKLYEEYDGELNEIKI